MNELHNKWLKKLKWHMKIYGFVNLLAAFVLMVYTFTVAYVGGGYEVIVTINDYNEAYPEIAMIIIAIPCIIYFIYNYMNLLIKEENYNEVAKNI